MAAVVSPAAIQNDMSGAWMLPKPDAAAPPQSQGFMLVGTLFIIPFILGYTFWSYYVFRGKVTHEDGYH